MVKKSKGLSKPEGPTPLFRHSKNGTARQLQADCCAEYISAYLLELVRGRDPRVSLMNMNPKTGEWQRVPPRTHREIEQKPTLQDSMAALTTLLLRRDGLPAAHHHIQQEIKAQVLSVRASVDQSALAAMSRQERHALANTLRRLQPSPQVHQTVQEPVELAALPPGIINLDPPEEDES